MKDIKKTEDLLKEFYSHRQAIKKMISDLETLKARIDKLFPEEKIDARFARFFEENIKTVTSLFTSLLEMRKEIDKNVKEEIEIRAKMEDEDYDEQIERIINVRKLAEKI
jgi:L-fucose mutarotase/ribose pyranase (RbsD/FucU family)